MSYPSFFYPDPKHGVSARTCEWWELDSTVGEERLQERSYLSYGKFALWGGLSRGQ